MGITPPWKRLRVSVKECNAGVLACEFERRLAARSGAPVSDPARPFQIPKRRVGDRRSGGTVQMRAARSKPVLAARRGENSQPRTAVPHPSLALASEGR